MRSPFFQFPHRHKLVCPKAAVIFVFFYILPQNVDNVSCIKKKWGGGGPVVWCYSFEKSFHWLVVLLVADEVKDKPVLIPVPIPVYLPTPMALYTAPTPTPIFIPVPIPVPIFIPTTRKSANGIMKQIKVGAVRIHSQCILHCMYPQLSFLLVTAF